MAVVKSLGQAWPENPETQQVFAEEFLSVLNAMVQNTTRKLQLTITKAVGQIMSSYNTNARTDEVCFKKTGTVLSFALSMPKNSQLRGEALDVLDQTMDVLNRSSSVNKEDFQNTMIKSLDDVIKDLATDAALKDMARKMKERLSTLNGSPMDCD